MYSAISDPQDKQNFLRKKLESLKKLRAPWESGLNEITELVMPHRTYMSLDTNPGEILNQEVYDQTGAQSAKVLTSTISSGTANPELKWFGLVPNEPELKDIPEVMSELNRISEDVLGIFGNPSSGFYPSNQDVIYDCVSYGTGCMFLNYYPNKGIKFKAIHISGIYIAEGPDSAVDTVIYEFRYTARQAIMEWGEENVGERILEAYKSDPERQFIIYHFAFPNDEYSEYKSKGKKEKYHSCYVVKDDFHIISEGFLEECPYNVPRWFHNTGVVWGKSPAWIALPDIRSVQGITMTYMEAAQFSAAPIKLIPDDGVLGLINVEPGGTIVGGRDGISGIDKVSILPIGTVPPALQALLEAQKEAIRRTFYNNSILFREGPQMTREEVLTRKEEQMQAIGPDIARFVNEHIIPVIFKTLKLALKYGLIKPINPEVKKLINRQGIRVEFYSPLIRSARLADLQSIERLTMIAKELAPFNPEVMMSISAIRAMNIAADRLGVPNDAMSTPDEIMAQKMLIQRQQQQAQALQVADMVDKNKALLAQAQAQQPQQETMPNAIL